MNTKMPRICLVLLAPRAAVAQVPAILIEACSLLDSAPKRVELLAGGEQERRHRNQDLCAAAGVLGKAYLTEFLDCYVFELLRDARDMTAHWLYRYNDHRPHEARGRIPPVEYRVKLFPNLYF